MFRQHDFATWPELEAHVRELLLSNAIASKRDVGHYSNVLFRGQASYGWSLDTYVFSPPREASQSAGHGGAAYALAR